MLLIEFDENLTDQFNILKYRNIDDDIWYYLYIDLDTLNLLLTNFGILSTKKIPTQFTNLDNPTTGDCIFVKYCGADITLLCNTHVNRNKHNIRTMALKILEQNY